MLGMFDATCEDCGKRFGWPGQITDRPPCPWCGHRPDPAELAAAVAQFAEANRLLALHPRDASPADLRRMRVLAGLTVGQAARLLGVEPATIRTTEEQDGILPAAAADRMAEVYGCGRES